jgi:ACS family glucarate transporter-like MFS transporter
MGSERPTRVRYIVVLLATLVAMMLYLDRICLSMAGPYVQEELGLSDPQMGLLLGAFFWTYAIGQVPAGWLGDRYGVRLTLGLFLALWSAFTGWMGLAAGFLLLLVLRLGCGLTEAGAYPACAGLVSVWVPAQRRGLASGIVSIGGRAGGAAAQVLTGYMIVAFSAGVASQFGADDLLDVSRFAQRPTDPAGKLTWPVKQKILARLPPHVLGLLRTAERVGPDAHFSPDETRAITDGLNQLLQERDLCRNLDLDVLDLPTEAVRLARQPENQLSNAEVERRNRLVLEAAFPRALRKLYQPGWRPTMVIYGLTGLLIALLFWGFFRNRPRQHPACNEAEVAFIEGGLPPLPVSTVPQRIPWRSLVSSGSLWLASGVQFCTNLGWAFLITWLPGYLKDRHVPIETRGWMAGLTLLCGIPGMYLGGWLSDRLKLRLGAWWGRSGLLALTRFIVMSGFLACIWLRSPWEVTVALAVVSWGTDLGTPAVWAYSQDVGGRHVGSVLGWGNMWGNFGAALSPTILAWVYGSIGSNAMFLTCAGAFLLAGIGALFINASKMVVTEGD